MTLLFRQMLNTFGFFMAFGPLVYFAISLFVADFQKTILCFAGVLLLASFLEKKLYNKKVKTAGKAVLITGCDSGFGNAAAHRLAEYGLTVFAGCLDAQKAEHSLKSENGKIIPLQMDVTRDDQVLVAKGFVEQMVNEEDLKLWAVVNNAGLAFSADAELSSMASTTRLMDVNFFGVLRVTNAFIPLLRHAKGSRVVSMASILSFVGLPLSGVYAASKAGVLRWSECLRLELMKFDIQVCCVCPDFYKTPMTDTDVFVASYDRELARLDKAVYAAYGDEYFNSQRDMIRNSDKVVMTNPDLSPVVNAICNCVLNYRPDPVHCPHAWPGKLMLIVLQSSFVPQILKDWILMTLSEQDRVPVAWSKKNPDNDQEPVENSN